jgi:hypothetical protein
MTIILQGVVIANDGKLLDLNSLPHVLAYSGSNIITDTVTIAGHTYTQTYTYNGSNQVTNVSVWTFIS